MQSANAILSHEVLVAAFADVSDVVVAFLVLAFRCSLVLNFRYDERCRVQIKSNRLKYKNIKI